MRQVVDAANVLSCDLVVLLGDYFATHRFVHRSRAAGASGPANWPRCAPRSASYSILGNHDWWHGIEHAYGFGAGAHPGHGKRRGAAGRGRPPLLAGRALATRSLTRLGHSQFRGVDDLPGTLKKITTADLVILLDRTSRTFSRKSRRACR